MGTNNLQACDHGLVEAQRSAVLARIEHDFRRIRSVGSALQAVADLARADQPEAVSTSLGYVEREGFASLLEVLGESVKRYAQELRDDSAEARRLSTGA